MNEQINKEFTRALSALETTLETPVIPGEFEFWAKRVRMQTDDVERLFRTVITPEQVALLQEIEDTDPELLHRVESLRKQQDDIQDAFGDFIVLTENAIPKTELREHNEGSVETLAKRVAQDGLNLVISLRKHALAVTTWFNEATLRDRGVQD